MIILGITGTNGSGKGVVVDYLKEKGFIHFSSSGYLAEELVRRGLEPSRTNLRMVGNEFRAKFGSGYLVSHFLEEASKNNLEKIAIESIRSVGETEKLKAGGGKLLLIDADRKIRYERIFNRKSGKDLIDFDTFVEQEEREWYGAEGEHDMNMRAVMGMADYQIKNEGTLEDLHKDLDEILKSL